MNPQEKLIEYAKELQEKSNTGLDEMDVKEIMAKAFTGGIRYNYDGITSKTCFVKREGTTILVIDQTRIVKETIEGETTTENNEEVMRIEL